MLKTNEQTIAEGRAPETLPDMKPGSWLDRPVLSPLTLNWETVLFIAILVLAVVTRFYLLEPRVMSHDENSHVYYSWLLYRGEGYSHDPVTHGPLQFHLLALSYFMFGANDFTARIPAVLFSIAAVAFMWNYRRYLGRAGGIVAAVLMLISPYMLYYGRYVRNEAFVALFVIISLWAILRYLDSGLPRYLFYLSAATVLHYTSKETSFIYSAQALSFLGLYLLYRLAQDPPRFKDLFARLRAERSFDLLILQGTLILPMLAPFPVDLLGFDPIAYTDTRSLMVTIGAVLVMAAIAIAVGLWWQPRLWLLNAALFYAIFTVLYTTVFTNGFGFVTGLVGSLGYWISQHEVNRGEQPLYYYALVQIPLYEFLPALGSLLALVLGFLGLRRRTRPAQVEAGDGDDPSAHPVSDPAVQSPVPVLSLLGFWAISSLAAYSIAGEKMPWLTVHITLPMILLSGWSLGRLIERADWRVFKTHRGWLTLALLVVFLVSLWSASGVLLGEQPPFQGQDLPALNASATFVTGLIAAIVSGAALIFLVGQWPARQLGLVTSLLVFAFLAGLTARAAFRAAYINYDNPVEPLVYAHSATAVKEILAQVEDISRRTTGGLAIKIAHDNESRYPYWWYLRDYSNVRDYGDGPTRDLRDYDIILVGDKNYSRIEPVVGRAYERFDYIRIWWPNQDYFKLKWTEIEAERAAELATEAAQTENGELPPMGLGEYLRRAWGHIRPFFSDPQVRSAIWQIWLNRDYNQYATLKNIDLSLPNWSPAARMRMYVRKDVLARLWNYGQAPLTEEVVADPYEGKEANLEASRIAGGQGSQPGQFQQPRGLTVAPDGTLWVADTMNHRLQQLDAEGNVLKTLGSFGDVATGQAPGGTFNQPWGIAAGPDGSIYVADTWNHRIQKFTAQGEFVQMWGYLGQEGNAEAFYGPRGIAVDREGRIYVTDTGNKRVVVFASDGTPLTQFGTAGVWAGAFDEPVGIAVDADGRVYVADTWNQRIQVFVRSDGDVYQYLNSWEVAGWFGQSVDNKPFIAIDDQQHLFASDPEGFRVLEFTNQGEFVRFWGDYGSEAGRFGLVGAVAADGQGGVWVSDTGNSRLMYFTPPRN